MSAAFSPRTQSQLVGRERELGVLGQHLDAAMNGHESLVLIGGEAGIGKTVLAETVCHDATKRGMLVLVGRCYDLTETPPYGPWIELFRQYRQTDGLPLLPAAFSQPGVLSDVAGRAILFNTVLDFFRDVSAHMPLVVLLDDLHWADPASLDLLRFLAQSGATLPMLLIATYRSDELTRHPLYPFLPLLVRGSQAERLDVRALTDDDMQTIVSARFDLPKVDTVRLVTYLRARAEGNPFFVGELLRTLEEMGVLHETDGHWCLDDVTQVRVPPLLRQVIDGRVARLGEEARDLLAVAAVIGQEVPLDVWGAVGATEEDMLLDIVERGIAAGLLVEMPDGERVQFAHALFREAIYEGVLATRRRRLHRAVAEMLSQTRHPDLDSVAYHFRRAGDVRAAAWLVQAGRQARSHWADRVAVDRLEAALALCDEYDLDAYLRSRVTGFLAMAYRYIDHGRAMHFIAEALRLAERLGDRRFTVAVLMMRAWLRLDAQHRQAGLADYLEAQAILERLTAEERAPDLSAPPYNTLAYAEGTVTDALVGYEGSLTEYLTASGQFTQARALGERFVADAPTKIDALLVPVRYLDALGNCYNGLHLTYFAQGEPERASRAAMDALRASAAAGNDMMCAHVTRFSLLRLLTYHTEQVEERRRLAEAEDTFRARWLRTLGIADPKLGILPVLALEGRWDEARNMTAIPPGGAFERLQWFVALTLGPLARAQGDMEMAWSTVRAALPDGPTMTIDTHFWVHASALRLGAALTIDAGNLAAARTWLTTHDELLTECEAVLGRSEGYALWAQYHRQAGDAEEARAHAERARAHASQPRQPLALFAAHRLLGEIDTDAGRFADAEEHLDAALALADTCAAPFERALILLAQAELCATVNQHDEAITLLNDARAIFTPLGAKPALARADALAAQLAGQQPAVPTYPDSLTPREVDVLRLIAAGRSNREIAATLFISSRTVNRHIENLYRKIGAHGKADATAYAFRQHLT